MIAIKLLGMSVIVCVMTSRSLLGDKKLCDDVVVGSETTPAAVMVRLIG